jgi:hypothetical protein
MATLFPVRLRDTRQVQPRTAPRSIQCCSRRPKLFRMIGFTGSNIAVRRGSLSFMLVHLISYSAAIPAKMWALHHEG